MGLVFHMAKCRKMAGMLVQERLVFIIMSRWHPAFSAPCESLAPARHHCRFAHRYGQRYSWLLRTNFRRTLTLQQVGGVAWLDLGASVLVAGKPLWLWPRLCVPAGVLKTPVCFHTLPCSATRSLPSSAPPRCAVVFGGQRRAS